MSITTARVAGCVFAVCGLFIAGCTYFGKPVGQDKTEADTLEQEIAGYRDWKQPDWFEEYEPSAHPLPAYVKYYINDAGWKDLDNPPNGAIFVKEQFDQDKNFIGLTVMKKIDGYDPENKDWYWAIADTNAAITNAGKLNSTWTSNCITCHKRGDGGGDLLFVND